MRRGSPGLRNFYPRPPRGGRPDLERVRGYDVIFLSTPSARRATKERLGLAQRMIFLSTPSARRATCILGEDGGRREISIHALREEGDSQEPALAPFSSISIHALREEGDGKGKQHRGGNPQFLSTPSARRATGFIMEDATNE